MTARDEAENTNQNTPLMKKITTILGALALSTGFALAADEKVAPAAPLNPAAAPATSSAPTTPITPATTPAVPAAKADATAEKPKRDPEVAFKKLDKDSDNAVSKDEFLAGPAGKRDEAKAGTAFGRKDKDKDGKLSLEEFKAQPQRKAK